MAKEVKNIDSFKGQSKRDKAVEVVNPARASRATKANAKAVEPVVTSNLGDALVTKANYSGEVTSIQVSMFQNPIMVQGNVKINQAIKKVSSGIKTLNNDSRDKKPKSDELSHLMLDGPGSYTNFAQRIKDGTRPPRRKPVE